jgi:hypothetical protein
MNEKSTQDKPKRKYKKFYQKPEWLIPIGISVFLAIIFGGRININQVTNSTNTAIVQDSSNVSISYTSVYNPELPDAVYTKEFTMRSHHFDKSGFKLNLFNVNILLPSKQEAFIKKYENGKFSVL